MGNTQSSTQFVAVIDIGKTNAKLALVDLEQDREIAVRTMPNAVLSDGLYPHYDCARIFEFLLDSLAAFGTAHAIDAISVTTHGATAVLLNAYGDLALPVLDYEFLGPDDCRDEYDLVRPSFDITGAPALPGGLNIGAQLFWQKRQFPEAFSQVDTIMMYPQYWSYLLTGVRANEATSLGCHTDLWAPDQRAFSPLVDSLGVRELMAPVRAAADVLGVISDGVAQRTGLRADVPVHCGIHDSNASLLPHLMTAEVPFSVVSTGTWVICMAMGGQLGNLDETRDSLTNVNAFGEPVPSARFMGGRAFSELMDKRVPTCTDAELISVLSNQKLLLPSVPENSGPFPGRVAQWSVDEASLTDGERFAVVSLHLALMTGTCLDLIGAQGPSIVEGPFSVNEVFAHMLQAVTGRPVVAGSASATGTSIGAARLAAPATHKTSAAVHGVMIDDETSRLMNSYSGVWNSQVRNGS